MLEFMVQLSSVGEIKKFVSTACEQSYDIAIFSGRYTVDAKSIMAVFGLDLSSPIRIEADCSPEEGEAFLKAVEKLVISESLEQVIQ